MRVTADGAVRRPPPGLPPAPDLNRYDRQTHDVVRVVVGTNPQEPLDLYLGAQKEAARIRDDMREVDALLASHKARYWAAGTSPSFYDVDRKALLARLKHQLRADYTGVKVTNDALDDEAHAHREYRDFIDREREGRLEMEVLQKKMSGLQSKLETALGVIAYYDRAIRLTEEMVRFARTERANTF
jgi:hypothetical protein